jgi:hypothetical protein
MSGQPADSFLDPLCDQKPDVNRIIDTFVSRFNAVYGDPATARGNIS